MLKFAVCDDEPSMIEEISGQLSAYMKTMPHTPFQIQGFPNGRSLLENDFDPDLIFLDIQMAHPDGMETARMLRRQKFQGLLVFVTILKEYVFDSFEVEAWDYLVKPLNPTHFRRTMDRSVRFLEQQASRQVLIQKGASCEVIPLSRIVYCEIQGRKLYIHQCDGRVTDYYQKLEAFTQHVDGRFFRCHRSYLVNLDYVRGCNGGQVRLASGDEIPVSRLREQDLTQALLFRMKERKF